MIHVPLMMLDVIVEVFDKQASVAASPLRTCSASHHTISSRTRTQHRHPDLMLLHTLSVDMIYIKHMTIITLTFRLRVKTTRIYL